jgi:hypothetical protein
MADQQHATNDDTEQFDDHDAPEEYLEYLEMEREMRDER